MAYFVYSGFSSKVKYELSILESLHGFVQDSLVLVQSDQGVFGRLEVAGERRLLQVLVHRHDLVSALILLNPPAHPETTVRQVFEDEP